MNKKAVTFSGWTEGILLTVLFVTVLSIVVIGGMNTSYSKDHQTGLVTNTTASFGDYAETSTGEIKEGEPLTSAEGLTLKSSWNIMLTTANVIWGFLTGAFITTAFGYMKAPATVGITFRLLYFISVIFILGKILAKIKW